MAPVDVRAPGDERIMTMEQRRRKVRLSVVCVTAAATGLCLGLALSASTTAAIQRIRRSWTFAARPVDASSGHSGLESDAALVLSFVNVTEVAEFEAQIDRAVERFAREARQNQIQVPRWRMFKSNEETVDHRVLYAFWISPAAASRGTALSSILRPLVPAAGNGQLRISGACSGERSLSLSFVSQIPR